MPSPASPRRITIPLVIVLAAALLGVPGARTAHASYPGANGVIAYEYSPPSGANWVWTSSPDGSGARPVDVDRSSLNTVTVTEQLLGTTSPSWAPDGRHLAVGVTYNCAYGANCSNEVALVDTQTGYTRQLTCDGAVSAPGPLDECRSSQSGPSVSPDGRQVAFVTGLQMDSQGEIVARPGSLVVVNASRSCRAPTEQAPTGCDQPASVITNDPDGSYSAPAAWSPDGRWLVSVRSHAPQGFPEEDLVAVRTDGSGLVIPLLDDVPGRFVNPDWSPDGTSIMVTGDGAGGSTLFTFRLECGATTCARTSDPEPLYTGRFFRGVYSPDGTRAAVDLAFGIDGTTGAEVWSMGLDGEDLRQVTSYVALGGAHTLAPSWQPTPDPAVEPPRANDQDLTTVEDSPVALALDVSDTSGQTLDFDLGVPVHGTLSGSPPELVYTPDPDFAGIDSFTWSAANSGGRSRVATATIAVTSVNDPPRADDIMVRSTSTKSTTITLRATDPEGDALVYRLVDLPDHGQASLRGDVVTYRPGKTFAGVDTFTYQVSDGLSWSTEATVSIQQNRAPSATYQALHVLPGGSVSFTLEGSDPDGDPLTLKVTHPPMSGTLTGSVPNLTYTPNPGFSSPYFDYLGFTVSDGHLTSAVTAVDFCVNETDACSQDPKRRRKFR
jgi:Tol biopolymer transport system component